MSEFTIKVIAEIASDDNVGDTNLKENEDSKKSKEINFKSLGQQLMGYIPGGSQINGAVSTIGTIGGGNPVAIAGLALSTAVAAYKAVYEFKRELRNTEELRRRAGLETFKQANKRR